MRAADAQVKRDDDQANSFSNVFVAFSADDARLKGMLAILKGNWDESEKHLEDALAFGGPYIFEVALEITTDIWQICIKEHIPPHRIVALTSFTRKDLFDNPALRREIFESNFDGSVDGFAGKVEDHRWK